MLHLLLLLLLLLLLPQASGSGRHSLWAQATCLSGTALFPEYTVVLMLDDIQVGYYDSRSDRLTRTSGGAGEGPDPDLGQEAVFVLRDIFSSMRQRLSRVKHRFNATVHVQQRLTGCEVTRDRQPALIMFRDATNGQDADSLLYNMTHFTYAGGEGWEIQWDPLKTTYFQTLYANIYLPFCVRTLKYLLDRQKHLVMRRVRPRVHLLSRPVAAGGARLTCLATDFYPRHINLSLLRDGRSLDPGELSGGSVLPNGNGLYQVRKTLVVGDEELLRKHNYTCAASHLSLDNRLEVSWRAELSRSHRVQLISAPVVMMVAAVLLLVLLWRRRRRGGETTDDPAGPSESAL